MNLISILMVAAGLLLHGCAAFQSPSSGQSLPVVGAKQDLELSALQLRNALLGHWYGHQPTEQGGQYQWLVSRAVDGTYRIKFRMTSPEGDVTDSEEAGFWGVSEPIYFSIMRGWINGDEFTQADPRDPYFYDAYQILELSENRFDYRSYDSGSTYTVHRVDAAFQMPASDEPSAF